MDTTGAVIHGSDDVRLLWHSNFYDVPLSGALTWQGKRYWFRASETEGTYDLLDLSHDQWAFEDAQHAAFREHVGHHTDYEYDSAGKCHRTLGPHAQADWSKFYDDPRWKDRPDPEAPIAARWIWFDPPNYSDDADD